MDLGFITRVYVSQCLQTTKFQAAIFFRWLWFFRQKDQIGQKGRVFKIFASFYVVFSWKRRLVGDQTNNNSAAWSKAFFSERFLVSKNNKC